MGGRPPSAVRRSAAPREYAESAIVRRQHNPRILGLWAAIESRNGHPGAHTMAPDEVLEVARAGEKLGCTEALFSLGDKPELMFPEMRETLRSLGYKSTLHYLEAMCQLVLRENRM